MATDPAPPPDLTRWSLHCFCLTARRNPKRVVELDNNGEILFRAAGGTTRAKIEADGVPVTESQLVLLETFRLIERRDGRIRTLFPMVAPAAISIIRDVAAAAARRALPGVSRAAKGIVSTLTARELAASAHAVVFGHALDGVMWDSLRRRGSLPLTELTVEEPFWRGALWAVYPGRTGTSGTNELSEGNNHLVMVWDEGSAEALRHLASQPGTRSLLRNLPVKAHSVSAASIINDGLDIPVVTSDDEVQSMSVDLAEEVAEVMPDGDESRRLLAGSGIDTSAEDASVIVAHELIWEVADMLERADLVSPPVAGDLASRVFVRVDL